MLPKGKPHEGQLFWVLLLSVGCTVVGSAWSSSSDLHLLSPTPGAPVPPALARPEHPQGPRHHQPLVSIYRSPASLRGSHGESRPNPFLFFLTLLTPVHLSSRMRHLLPTLYHSPDIPPSHCPSASPSLCLPPQQEDITTVDSSCASWSCLSFM